ncbi:tryptophanase leader peptide [Alysiella sp.]
MPHFDCCHCCLQWFTIDPRMSFFFP